MRENPYEAPHICEPTRPTKLLYRLVMGSLVVLLVAVGSVAGGIGVYLVLVSPEARRQGGNPLLVLLCVGVIPIACLLQTTRLLHWLFAKMQI
jgi:hypothetical protein